jgi:hypothetical protein
MPEVSKLLDDFTCQVALGVMNCFATLVLLNDFLVQLRCELID